MLIDDVAMKMVRKGDDVIMIGSNAPAGETLPHIRNAAKRALDSGYTKYGPTSGLFELRQAVADKLKREYDFEADPESEILLTNGAEEAIFLAMQALVNSGDEVLQSKPSYPFDLHVNYSEGISTEYRLEERNGWKLDAERVESRVSRKTRLVTLVNPHSPTGRVFTREELEEFSEIAVKRNLFVLVDHVYSDLVYDGRRHINIANLPGMRERTVIVCSFSKSYPGMGGWRVGYAVGNRKLIAEMTKLHGLISNMGGCTFAQKGAVEAYLANQTPLSRMVRKFQRQRDASVKRLNE
ncbi:MAG: hypothetical protein AUI83_11830, partial [Armatimonadetes bacterium 13_1_40CM_3_65_7]